ncbi:hypothetical protein VTK73DRAFT_8551 [Phialemonium thermophilum]|uniref:FHA domain-containing protein n=1 Tax=Phialemonium thermophilum TaxID=223376 RepID=A0ABR3XNJ0_9PEZI
MTAVANPHSFANLNRPAWGISGGQTINAMNPDDVRNMFASRKTIPRTNSSSSIASSSSASSTGTVTQPIQANGDAAVSMAGDLSGWSGAGPARKRPQAKGQWAAGKPDVPSTADFGLGSAPRPPLSNGAKSVSVAHQASSMLATQGQIMQQPGLSRPSVEALAASGQPVLSLLSLNGTFDRKTISVPFYPEKLRIGRQTNAKTIPTPVNGFFDSKVLSRQHAEIWADRSGKIWIRDVKSSNGTFVNGTRLSQENRESEPHELQPQDHLELGIDIVSEDQKTVVHHKVAAKVEHAGFMGPSNGVLDVNFGDLDPSGAGMMLPGGAVPYRNRAGSQASVNGRGGPAGALVGPQAGGLQPQRQLWVNPVTTEHIVKRLHNEMRSARLQKEDLTRTAQFVNALLSKDDIKNQEKADGPEHARPLVNGAGLSFRSDGVKTRFSDPPAPPPSQPLPEKPDAARSHGPDVPPLKRGVTERPKAHSPVVTNPARQDNTSQILQLTEALSSAKKEIDSHNARVRELEEMVRQEREARLQAEGLIQRLEESTSVKMNGSAVPSAHVELSTDRETLPEPPAPERDVEPASDVPPTPSDKVEMAVAAFQAQIDAMATEMRGLREQLAAYRERAEKAETERDSTQRTLAELVMEIRRRDDKEKLAAQRRSRSRSTSHHRSTTAGQDLTKQPEDTPTSATTTTTTTPTTTSEPPVARGVEETAASADKALDDQSEAPTLSRANTITPSAAGPRQLDREQVAIQGLPYASMLGVVLFGVGLMVYINGWQPQPRN